MSILVIGLLVLVLTSCKSMTAGGAKKPLVETPSIQHYQAPDVPVPANFFHSQKESYAYISNKVRTTSIKYIGSARTDDLLEFYRRQMPNFGWMEKMSEGVENKTEIVFQKEREKCRIVIEQKPTETILDIKIGFNL